MNPFMHTFTDPPMPCWHNEMLAPGRVYMVERTDWTAPWVAFAASMANKARPRIVDVQAHPDTWSAIGAYHLAEAYRPEVPR